MRSRLLLLFIFILASVVLSVVMVMTQYLATSHPGSSTYQLDLTKGFVCLNRLPSKLGIVASLKARNVSNLIPQLDSNSDTG